MYGSTEVLAPQGDQDSERFGKKGPPIARWRFSKQGPDARLCFSETLAQRP